MQMNKALNTSRPAMFFGHLSAVTARYAGSPRCLRPAFTLVASTSTVCAAMGCGKLIRLALSATLRRIPSGDMTPPVSSFSVFAEREKENCVPKVTAFSTNSSRNRLEEGMPAQPLKGRNVLPQTLQRLCNTFRRRRPRDDMSTRFRHPLRIRLELAHRGQTSYCRWLLNQ